METFEEIFEQDARWMTGQILIGQMIEDLKGKPPTVRVEDYRTGSITFEFPDVGDMLHAIPNELFTIFTAQCHLALKDWLEDRETELNRFLHLPMNTQTMAFINSSLSHMKREELAMNTDRQLHRCFARRMGCQRDRLENIKLTMTRKVHNDDIR